jgi:hypothetical protein
MSIKEYRRANDIKFFMTREAAKLLVIALDLEALPRVDLDREVAEGLVALTEGYFVTGRMLYQVYGGAIRKYAMPTGWAVGVLEIPWTASNPSSSWAGGERTETFRTKVSGVLIIPEGLSGEIICRTDESADPVSTGVHGNKSFMGGFVA